MKKVTLRQNSFNLRTQIAIFIIFTILLFIHIFGIFVVHKTTYPLKFADNFTNGTKIKYLEFSKFSFFTSSMAQRSELSVDNRTLAILPDEAPDGAVRFGGKRFYVSKNGTVVFSTHENSLNSYQVTIPTPIPGFLLILYLILFISFSYKFFRESALTDRLKHHSPTVTYLSFTFMYLMHRSYFLDYPILAVHPDSGSYYAPGELINSGIWPNFGNRPFFYPIFLFLVFKIQNSLVALAIAQSLFSLLASLILLSSIYRINKNFLIPSAITIFVATASVTALEHDTAMLSESVYTSLIMLSFAYVIRSILNHSLLNLVLMALFSSFAFFTRPQGIFLVAINVLVLIYLLLKIRSFKIAVAILAPILIIFGGASLYNAKTVQVASPTTWGEANLAVATMLYWEQDAKYPAGTNRKIGEIRNIIDSRHKETQVDVENLDTSWNLSQLAPIYVNSFNGSALDIAMSLAGNYENESRKWIRTIAFDSIKKNPKYYSKFLFTMLSLYYIPSNEFVIDAYLKQRISTFYVEKYFSKSRGIEILTSMGKNQADSTPPISSRILDYDAKSQIDLNYRIQLEPTPLLMVNHAIVKLLLEKWPKDLLLILFFFTPLSLLLTYRRSGFNQLFIIKLVLFSGVFMASLVVSAVEYSQPRYSYPMQWALEVLAILNCYSFFEFFRKSLRVSQHKRHKLRRG